MTFDPKVDNQGTPAPAPTPGQENGGGQPAPAYITLEQFQAELAKERQAFEDKLKDAYRGVQSLTDKNRAQLQQLDGFVNILKESGQQIDAANVDRAKMKILTSAYNEPAAPASPATPPAQAQPAGDDIPPEVMARIEEMEETFGVQLPDEAPELKGLEQFEYGSKPWFAHVRKAHQAYAARLAQETPERAQARSPMFGSAGAPPGNSLKGLTQDQLWEKARTPRR